MGRLYSLIPVEVEPVETRYRRISTKIPVPESIPVLERLRKYESRSMGGQPPVVWDRAEGVSVYDAYGNMWLDFSSGVLVANAGHGNKPAVEGIRKELEKPLLHNYCFPSEIRSLAVEKLANLSPKPLDKVFLLTTGAEAVECAIKLARTWGGKKGKKTIVSFEGSFHGRTLGAQMAGGIPGQKEWADFAGLSVIHVPFPGEPRCPDRSFALFESTLEKSGVSTGEVCAVISETYQGVSAALMPRDYAVSLRSWCDRHGALLIFDEIQAGFGRTGRMFGFMHYGIIPDLFCLGKGISGSLPLSAVVGRPEIMDQYGPGEMTSTHTGNPLSCAAFLGSIREIEENGLVENARAMGRVFKEELERICGGCPLVQFLCGEGLVWGIQIGRKGTDAPDPDTAFRLVERCMQKGLLFFSPVGIGGGTVKVNPPLSITREAVLEGCGVIGEVLGEVCR